MCQFVCVWSVCSERDFEKQGTTNKATSGHVVSNTEEDDNSSSLLAKLSSLKRKLFG